MGYEQLLHQTIKGYKDCDYVVEDETDDYIDLTHERKETDIHIDKNKGIVFVYHTDGFLPQAIHYLKNYGLQSNSSTT